MWNGGVPKVVIDLQYAANDDRWCTDLRQVCQQDGTLPRNRRILLLWTVVGRPRARVGRNPLNWGAKAPSLREIKTPRNVRDDFEPKFEN